MPEPANIEYRILLILSNYQLKKNHLSCLFLSVARPDHRPVRWTIRAPQSERVTPYVVLPHLNRAQRPLQLFQTV